MADPRSISLDGVGFAYGEAMILEDLTATFSAGEITGLVGPSGSGKSTLLALLTGERRPAVGAVRHHGLPVHRGHLHPLACAWIMQTANLMVRRSALANVALPCRLRGDRRHVAHAAARSALGAVDLGGFARRRCLELSGGERQRVAVARAIAGAAPVVLADEPTAALDAANRDRLADALVAAARDGAIVVVATHDQAVAARCDTVLHLR